MDPLIKQFSLITKFYRGALGDKLKNLPIKRYYYTLLVIGNRNGKTTLKELAEILHVDKVTMTRAIHYLVDKRLIIKKTKRSDRRSWLISLTGKGEASLKKIKNAYHEIDRQCMEGVNGRKKDNFFNALAYIMNKLEGFPGNKLKFN